jgi:hypothetical protein
MLLRDPAAIENPFFMMAPDWAALPLVGLATAATVIASQALITAAFSVTRQAIQLGLLPRMRILHTSVKDLGQIYIPFVNWGLYLFIVLAVALFKSSTNLASAYGIAVTLDMTITTVMTFFVIRHGWKYPLPLCVAATGFFFVIDIAFFASNMLKLFGGGWFPLVIADFQRDELDGEFDALLGEPGDVPEVAVFDAVLAEGERDDFVGQDFLAALRLKNESRGAEVDAVEIAQHHRTRVVAGDGADIEVDALRREMLPAGAGLDGQLPGGDLAAGFDRLTDANREAVAGLQSIHEHAGEFGQITPLEATAASEVEVLAES